MNVMQPISVRMKLPQIRLEETYSNAQLHEIGLWAAIDRNCIIFLCNHIHIVLVLLTFFFNLWPNLHKIVYFTKSIRGSAEQSLCDSMIKALVTLYSA